MRAMAEVPQFTAGDSRHGRVGYACAVCNDLAAQAPGDLCGACSLTAVVVCTRCGGVQEQYGPCIHCESGR